MARQLYLGAVLAVAAPCTVLVVAGLGCTFPEVTFADRLLRDGGPAFVFDAGQDGALPGEEPPPDAGDGAFSNPDGAAFHGDGSCDFNGTWGTRITIDVTWQPQGLMSVILQPGHGTITQWVKGERVQSPSTPLSLSDDSRVCGIALPDFQATALGLNGVYGVRFPDSLFDDNYIPRFTVNGALTPQNAGGYTYSTTPTAVLLGLTMASPTTDPWPATIANTIQDDMDMDGNPGVTVAVAVGPVADPMSSASLYSYIPTDVPPPLQQVDLASSLYLAIRQITVASGTVQDCNTIVGSVNIPMIASKPAIDSHILGCRLVDGGQCTTGASSEAAFVDNSEPIFTLSGNTTFQSMRMPPGATCADVRNAFH
jgi:hypothetical protein